MKIGIMIQFLKIKNVLYFYLLSSSSLWGDKPLHFLHHKNQKHIILPQACNNFRGSRIKVSRENFVEILFELKKWSEECHIYCVVFLRPYNRKVQTDFNQLLGVTRQSLFPNFRYQPRQIQYLRMVIAPMNHPHQNPWSETLILKHMARGTERFSQKFLTAIASLPMEKFRPIWKEVTFVPVQVREYGIKDVRYSLFVVFLTCSNLRLIAMLCSAVFLLIMTIIAMFSAGSIAPPKTSIIQPRDGPPIP